MHRAWKTKISPLWIFTGCWLLFVAGTGLLSRHFPIVGTDEVFISVHGLNLVSGQGNRYSLYDDIYARSVYSLRDAFGQVEETIYGAWVGLWLKAACNYRIGRLASLTAAWLVLWVFYALGSRIQNPRMGLLLGLLVMSDPVFITASCVTRPETLLLLGTAGVLWLLLKIRSDFFLKGFWMGLISGLQVAIHPNAVALLPGFWTFAFLSEKRERRLSLVGTLIAGSVGGILAALCMTDLHKLWLVKSGFQGQLVKPTLFSPPRSWSALLHLLAIKTFLIHPPYSDDPTGLRETCFLLRHLGIAAALIGICFERLKADASDSPRPAWWNALAAAGLVSFLATVAVVAQTELGYKLNLLPFFLPCIAYYGVQENHLSRHLHTVLKITSGLLIGVSFCLFLPFIKQYEARSVAFPVIQSQLEKLVPDKTLKIVAPNLFWYQWPKDRFRDVGAMTYSHWYAGGSRDVSGWLAPWQPDILIIDKSFRQIFLGPGPSQPALARLLKNPVTFLGTIDTGASAYGTFEVFDLRKSAP
jgi:hypothetical protein